MGSPAHLVPFNEQKSLPDQLDGLTTNALLTVMPWRLLAAPHLGDSPMYTSSIPVFRCPSSELGRKSPDAWNTATPDINALNQAALHYRANGGSAMSELLEGNQSRHAWWCKSGVGYPKSTVRFADITEGNTNTLILGETSSAFGRPLFSAS